MVSNVDPASRYRFLFLEANSGVVSVRFLYILRCFLNSAVNGKVNYKFKETWKEVVVACFKLPSQQFLRQAEEYHKYYSHDGLHLDW
jgi:hypothetical protein